MKLTTDIAIKKWKPKSKGERVGCGQNLYVQGWLNGSRAWVQTHWRVVPNRVPTSASVSHTLSVIFLLQITKDDS